MICAKCKTEKPFKLAGELSGVETIAAGRAVRDLARLRRLYGEIY